MGSAAASRETVTPAPIRVLPPKVADRIAAGEVIERPTSVVRELLDNAIDADASDVRIEVRGSGLELIRVSDNGYGIPADQVDLAFQRHATSKIQTPDDLLALRTLGFRGEALPSIAAVAEATMLSRDADSDSGALIVVRASAVLRRGRVAREVGTTLTVRHLFLNVPARLKFLPAGRGESLLIAQLVRRYSLAHPHVRFSLTLDGRLTFRSTGSGQLETALAEVYGPGVVEAMHPLPALESDRIGVSGLLGGHGATRPGRNHVTLIINRRWTGNRALFAALEAAYRPFLPAGRHPIAAIVVSVPPAELDQNVHPAKTEVRLLHEQEVADTLTRAVRETLGRRPVRPAPSAKPPRGTAAGAHGRARGPGWSCRGRRRRNLRTAHPLDR